MSNKINNNKRNNLGQYTSIDPNDIVDQKIGKLKILSVHHQQGKHWYYNCKCECGENTIKERSALKNKINLQCMNCYYQEKIYNIIKDMIGRRFGRLEVKDFDHLEYRPNIKKKNAHLFFFKCKCDCGNICIVDKYFLTSGKKESCGCLQSEVARIKATTHNMSKTKFYQKWSNMIDRCINPNNDSYYIYGKRGIKVCNRWLKFENFRDDMYESYLKHVELYAEIDTTLERINVNGNYEPNNCTWATRAEQNRNMTTNFRLYYNDNEYIVADLHRTFCPDISYRKFYNRIKSAGYKSGDTINPTTCYNDIFKNTHIIQPIIFNNPISTIICPIEFEQIK